MTTLYFCTESENILEEKNGKWRILDETNDFKPYARFQKLKEDEEGEYLLNQGEKNHININSLDKLEREELSFYAQ